MDWFVEFVKKHVDDATAEKIAGEFNGVFPKHAVPKEQYNNKVDALRVAEEEKNTASSQLEKVNSDLSGMQALVGENEELKTAMANSSSEFEEYKKGEATRISDIKKGSAIERALLIEKADPDNIDILAPLFDKSKIVLTEDGNLDGFKSQLDSLREKRPAFFAKIETNSPEPIVGDNTPVKDSDFDKAMETILS